MAASRARKKPSGATQEERDRIALGVIEAYMDAVTSGTMYCPTCHKAHPFKEITPAAATLLRARYDKLRPTLSAVEQSVTDHRDKLNPAELETRLKAMYEANPELFSFISQPSQPVCAAPIATDTSTAIITKH